jgi:tetratricopeptide (TPR) repeat protein
MQGRYFDAIALYEQVVRDNQALTEADKVSYLHFHYRFEECYLHEGRHPEAICICKQLLQEIGKR